MRQVGLDRTGPSATTSVAQRAVSLRPVEFARYGQDPFLIRQASVTIQRWTGRFGENRVTRLAARHRVPGLLRSPRCPELRATALEAWHYAVEPRRRAYPGVPLVSRLATSTLDGSSGAGGRAVST